MKKFDFLLNVFHHPLFFMDDNVPNPNELVKIFPNLPLPVYRIAGRSTLYFKHWEVQFLFPTIVIVLVIMGLAIYFTDLYPYIENPNLQMLSLSVLLFSLTMFLWSYFAAVCMDPGFLPFNWSQTKRSKYGWKEILEGTALTSDQVCYAENHSRPIGSCFSHSYGKFVLRPDHVCGWIANWVGKRNHKQFILFLLYGSFLSASFVFPHAFQLKEKPPLSVLLTFFHPASILVELVLAVGLFSGFLQEIYHLYSNSTSLQRMVGNKFVTSTNPNNSNGMIDVCGLGPKFWYIFPTPAFGDYIPLIEQTPLDLLKQFSSSDKYKFVPVQDVPILDRTDVL